MYIVIDTAVFDCSKFADLHPGGGGILLDKDVAGKDATAGQSSSPHPHPSTPSASSLLAPVNATLVIELLRRIMRFHAPFRLRSNTDSSLPCASLLRTSPIWYALPDPAIDNSLLISYR